LIEGLKPLQRATLVEAGLHPRVVATIYQLIDSGSSGSYRDAANHAAALLPDLTVRVSGPFPAYRLLRRSRRTQELFL
jgi:hypothetical protein